MDEPDTASVDESVRKRRAHRFPRLCILFANGRPGDGTSLAVPRGTTVLGRVRGSEPTLVVADEPTVSRVHARARWDGDRLEVEDAGSHNGTFLNGVRVRRAVVGDGDLLRLGAALLMLRMEPPGFLDGQVPELRGRSPVMRALRAEVEAVGPTGARVLLLGETGSGKGVAAEAIHRLSRRRGRFVAFNCAAIPEGTAESQIFGHRAGSFTGATGAHDGFVGAADHGTLLIDEVGDMPPSLQAKLLRALEHGEVTPVGSSVAVRRDVRILAATNVDLVSAVKGGRFRGDLYARLAEVTLRLPALRDHREDVLPLLVARLPKELAPLSAPLAEALVAYDWPFNVREVERVAGELAVRGRGREVLDLDLVEERLHAFTSQGDARRGASAAAPARGRPAAPTAEELARLLQDHGGVVAEAARASGRSVRQLYRWMARLGVDPDTFRASPSARPDEA